MTGSATATTAMAADNDKRRDTALPLSLSVTVSYPTLLNYTLQIQLNSQLSRTPINPNWIWHKDKTTTASIAPIACRAICRPPRKNNPALPCSASSQMCRLTIFQRVATPLNGLHLRSQPATWYKQISHFYVTLCLKYFTFFAAIFSPPSHSLSLCPWRHYISSGK